MKTLKEYTDELKAEYPSIREGSDEAGYTDLDAKAYEAKIKEWALNLFNEEKKKAETVEAKNAILEKLGITQEEANLLLS